VELYNKLITEDKVNFLLGPYGSAPTNAVAPIAEKYKLPMVTGHGSAGRIYSAGNAYVFNIQTPAENYLHGVIDLVLAKDPSVSSVAVLSEDDPFSNEVAAGAMAYARLKRLRLVYNHTYPSNTQDISAILAAVKEQKPELLLGAGHLQDALLVVKQAKELGVEPKAIGLSVGPSAPQFRENLRGDADYVLGATQWTAALNYRGDDLWQTPAAFAAAFRAKYPRYKSVPYQVAESAAALIVFQRALEGAGTLDRQAVRDAIAGLDAMTFFGPIKFDDTGKNVGKPMVLRQVQDDKYAVVAPTKYAAQPVEYPRQVASR